MRHITSALTKLLLITLVILLPYPSTLGASNIPSRKGLLKGQLINAVFACIGRYYVDFKALKVHEVLQDAMRGVERAVPNVMVSVDTSSARVQIDGVSEVFEIGGIEYWAELRDRLKEILCFIESSGNCDVPYREMEYAALSSILGGFDPYCKLYQPKDFSRAESLGSGSFVGVGIDIEFREGVLSVVQVYEGSSAHSEGLRVGDRIVEIDGESARKMSLTEALHRLTGPAGSSVSISVVRNGSILSYTLERRRVNVRNVDSALLEGNIGYIKIGNFQDGTFEGVVHALEGLKKRADLRGLVLDFRGNYGGVMEEIIRVGDLFLSSGILTIKVSTGRGYPDFVRARASGNREEGYPLVILIDEGSASGAEILAAAFKENGRAIIMGERSFGKACIQQVFGLKGRYAIKLTTARYFTPRGRYIQYVGLAPDILLIPVSVEPNNPTLTRRVHYLNEGLVRERIEKPSDGDLPLASLVYLEGSDRSGGSGSEDGPDYQVQLAKRLISEGAVYGGVPRWDVCRRILRRAQKEEEKKIVRALRMLGIDWSSGMPDGLPVPIARINLDKEINEVEAGGEIEITVTVENRGDGTLYRVLGRSSSTNPIFDGLEFPIGMVEPGQRGSYTLRVAVPIDSLDRRDEVVIKFTEDNDYTPDYVTAWITIWARPVPVFAYSYRVLDGDGGAGDGLIEAGEDIQLKLSLRNIGEGDSSDTVVMLKALHAEVVRIDKPRLRIGHLGAKEEKMVGFGLSINEDTSRNNLELEIVVADLNLGVNLLSRLTLPIERGHVDVESYSGLLEVTGDAVRVYGGRSTAAPVLTTLIKGSVIRVDGRVQGWFRIPLTGELSGWVEAGSLRKIVDERRGEEGVVPVSFLPFRPPTVTVREGVLTARAGTVELKFHVEDDQDIRSVYIMVNDVKVFYKYDAGRTSRRDFTAELPISRGLNLVRVVAYDDQGLSAEKPFVITGI